MPEISDTPPTPARPRRDLTTGPVTPALLAFALPTLGSNILQSLNGSINAVWTGRFLGESALAATSNANLVMFLMIAAVFGFGMAATILVGQAWGRHDVDAARRAVGSALGLVLLASVVVAALGWAFTPQLLGLLGTPGEAAPLAAAYLRVIFLGMPAMFLLGLLMMSLRGVGDSLTPLWFMALSVVLDSGLNPVLILGWGPFPRLGIAGSATATLIANYVSVTALLATIYARDLPLRLRGPELSYLWPDPALLRTVIAKGLPIGAQMIVVSVSGLAMMGLVNREGVVVAAAYGVTSQLWTYIQMPAMAIGAAVSAMAAQNIGAGRWDRIGAITRAGVLANVAITGAAVVLLTLIDVHALGLFLGESSPALPVARHVHLVVSWVFVPFGVMFVLFATVRANGAVLAPLAIMAIALLPVRLGLAYALHPTWGAEAIWWSFPAGSMVATLLAIAYYRRGDWRQARLAESPPDAQQRSHADPEPGAQMQPAG